jgi:hypothetical protein
VNTEERIILNIETNENDDISPFSQLTEGKISNLKADRGSQRDEVSPNAKAVMMALPPVIKYTWENYIG